MKTKTHTLINGVAFLAIAGIVVKVLGLICKIPLVHVIGEDGMGYFNSAYTIYNLFFMLSNAGLPVAISILISEQYSKGDAVTLSWVFRRVFFAVCALGIAGGMVLAFFARPLSCFVGNPDAIYCIWVMAPVFLFVCIAGGLRGYFQGMQQLVPTGMSQLIEALCKTLGCVFMASYAVKQGFPLSVCAAFSLLGILLGSILSMVYLLLLSVKQGAFFKIDNLKRNSDYTKLKICKRLFLIAFPITVGSLVMSLSNFMDLTVVMRELQKGGLSPQEANRIYGNYTGLAIPLFNLPPVLIMPIAYATVPGITSARIQHDAEKAAEIAHNALKAVGVIALPFVFGLLLFARPILMLLFESESAMRAAPLLSLLGPSVFFVGVVAVTGSILQACRKPMIPVFAMGCGAGVKWIVSCLLIERKGIIGAPIGTLCCYAVIAVIHLVCCMRYCNLHIGFLKGFWIPFISSFGSSLLGRILYVYLCTVLPERISVCLVIPAVAILYFILLIMFRAFTRQQLEALPMPRFLKLRIMAFMPEKERNFIDEKCKGTEKSGKLWV